MSKSQVSIELLVLVGFLFIIALGFIVAAGVQMSDYRKDSRDKTISEFGDSIKIELDTASTVKDGYKRDLLLPDRIDGTYGYNITTESSTLIIYAEGSEYSWQIPNIIGSLKKGDNLLQKQEGVIKVT